MIWILWHRRIGDLNQMQDLARATGLPFEIKKLQFRKPHYAPLARLATDSDSLNAPWPKVILCTEALSSVVARRLKQQSGGAIKIVSLARPAGDVRNFDLVLTTAQYRLAKLPHVVELMLPLTTAKSAAETKSNILTVLVGASSPPEILDAEVAHQMAADIKAYANAQNFTVKLLTSPRTSSGVAQAFLKAFAAPHQVHIWVKDRANPYQTCVAEAAEIIVTSDSASMLADGLVAGKRLQIYRLPRHFTVLQNLVEWLFKDWPESFIFRSGIIEPATDRRLLVDRLIVKGYARWFGDAQTHHQVFDPKQDMDLAVAEILKLSAR